MKYCVVFIVCLIGCILEINAQYDGPIPQRQIIPGAVPARPLQIPGAVRSGPVPRQGRLLQARRPAPGFYRASPTQNIPPPPPSYSTPTAYSKPVTEEPEEDNVSPYGNNEEQNFDEQLAQKQALLAQLNEDFTPSFLSTSPQTSPAPVQFRPEPKIPQVRPQQVRVTQPIQRNDPPQTRQYQPQPQQQVIQRARPAPRPAPQQIQTPRDYPSQGPSNERRLKKPVAQILRKYQEENEDGSITWGYENDDGSFKEETIGIDCITRGKYGYVDPDGVRREYNYETGHACDPVEEEPVPQQVPTNQQPKRPRFQ